MFPLGTYWFARSQPHELRKHESPIGDPARPFPFVQKWDQQAEEKARGAGTPWDFTDGAVPISFEGCAGMVWLVVAGPERGHVWEDFTSEGMGWWPWNGHAGQRVSFVEWWATWLDRRLPGEHFRNE